MTAIVDAEAIRIGLTARLQAVAPLLLPDESVDSGREVSALLGDLVQAVRCDLTAERVWLLLIAVSGAFPDPDEVVETKRQLELADVTESTLWMLRVCGELVTRSGNGQRDLEIVSDAVMVQVDHTAFYDPHTGVGQVIRRTIPRWQRDHDIVLAGWTPGGGALRRLLPIDLARIVTCGRHSGADDHCASSADSAADSAIIETPIIVPWRSVLVLADVASPASVGPLTALARFTSNRVVAVGYDCMPVVGADLVRDAARFVHYLSLVKHIRQIAAISGSAAVEFQGFVDTLPAQGLTGPEVSECQVASEPIIDGPTIRVAHRPMILSVGNLEPCSNHLATLYAAETLWREGLPFELRFIGGIRWGTEVTDRVDRLRAAGRPITVRHHVSQIDLEQAYVDARFTVFPSLHESCGLLVAESLAAGVPVITSEFGGTADTGAAGGALLIDPRDDDALARAMRLLLTDDRRLDELRDEIATRPTRSWDDFARDLWELLITTQREEITRNRAARVCV